MAGDLAGSVGLARPLRSSFASVVVVVALCASALVAVSVGQEAAIADPAPTLFEPIDVAGGHGFRSGPADEIGMAPSDLAARADGSVVVLDGAVIRLIDPTAGTNTVIAGLASATGVPDGMRFGPDIFAINGVAAGPGGEVYANVYTSLPTSPFYGGMIVEVDLTASTITPIAGGGVSSWGDGQDAVGTFLLPTALWAAPDGTILFYTGTGVFGPGAHGPSFVRLDPATGTLDRLIGGGNVQFASWPGAAAQDIDLNGLAHEAIVSTADGSLYFLSVGRIWKVELGTGVIEDLVTYTYGPRGLAVSDDGSLLTVTNAGGSQSTLAHVDATTGSVTDVGEVPVSVPPYPVRIAGTSGAALLLGRDGASRRDVALLSVASDGAITVLAGNGADDRWQGEGAAFSTAFFPNGPSVVAGPDDRLYALRDEGIAIFDPVSGLTSSVHVPGLVTDWSVYTAADLLGLDSDGRAIVRSVVPIDEFFGDYAIDLVDLTTGTFQRAYGPSSGFLQATGGLDGDLYVVDPDAGQTIHIDRAGSSTVVGDAPFIPVGLWTTPSGDLFADLAGLYRLEGGTWALLDACGGGGEGSPFAYDGAGHFLKTSYDVDFNTIGCQYDPATDVDTDLGPAPIGIPAGSTDSAGFLWFPSDVGLTKMLVRTAGPPPCEPSGYQVTELTHSTFGGATGVTTGPDGNLWVVSGDRVVRITPAGVATPFTAGITPGSSPWSITPGPDGNLWFTEYHGNRIGRITPSGVVTEFAAGITTGSYPVGITAGPDGNLWFTEHIGHRIGRITTSGVITEFPVGPAGGGLNGIAAGPDGNLWFAHSSGVIGRITPAGVATQFSAGITPGSYPKEITAGPDGNLWFTEHSGNRIGRITPAGVVTEFATGITAGSAPNGITTGADGNLWFTEWLGDRIGRITPAGVVTEYANGITPGSGSAAIIAWPGGGGLHFTQWYRSGGLGRVAPGSCSQGTPVAGGTADVTVSSGTISSLASNPAPASPPPPAGRTFPYGLFDFTITGVAPGATVTVTITLPGPVTEWWKLHGGTWTRVMNAKITGNQVQLSLTDNGPLDEDPTPGTIVDPSGPSSVQYAWNGFLSPVANPPKVNTAKAGSSVPMKFGLGGNLGLDILAQGSPTSTRIECPGSTTSVAPQVAPTSGTLSYDTKSRQYTYLWKTDRAWRGTCRRFTLTLANGTTHQATFKLNQ